MEKETIEDEKGRVMNCQHYFKKLDKFGVCAFKADKGMIEIEPDSESCGIYHYVYYGSAKIGKPFSSDYKIVKKGDYFDMKDYLYEPRLYEALEDLYVFGFNVFKGDNWDSRLLKDETLKVDDESCLICLDGMPEVNGKKLGRFNYADLSTEKEYDINLNGGIIALYTKV